MQRSKLVVSIMPPPDTPKFNVVLFWRERFSKRKNVCESAEVPQTTVNIELGGRGGHQLIATRADMSCTSAALCLIIRNH